MKEPVAAMNIKVTLLGLPIHSKTWRRLRVPISIRYDQLEILIQLAFGIEEPALYEFTPFEKQIQYVNHLVDPSDNFDTNPILADKGYPYPHLIKSSIMLDVGSDWEFDIKLESTLSFHSIKNLQLPYCIVGSDDENEKSVPQMHITAINKNYALWARAGERMVPGSSHWPFHD